MKPVEDESLLMLCAYSNKLSLNTNINVFEFKRNISFAYRTIKCCLIFTCHSCTLTGKQILVLGSDHRTTKTTFHSILLQIIAFFKQPSNINPCFRIAISFMV